MLETKKVQSMLAATMGSPDVIEALNNQLEEALSEDQMAAVARKLDRIRRSGTGTWLR